MTFSFEIQKVLKITKYISFKIFIASFLTGLLFLYIIGPENKTVYVYPSPQTVDRAIFQDRAKQCFLYQEENVDCPLNKKEINVIPVQ